MSLDIAILDDAGYPATNVAVAPERHVELMEQAEALSLPLLSKMHDYYADVDYTPQEAVLLRDEADKLAAQCGGKPELCALIEQIQSLTHLAAQNGKEVVAIAD